MSFDFAEKVGSLDEERQLKFYEHFAHNLTIIVRGIWSDENLTDAEKVDRMKWINEIQHRVTAKIYVLRRHLHEWSAVDFGDAIRGWVGQNRENATMIDWALNNSYLLATR